MSRRRSRRRSVVPAYAGVARALVSPGYARQRRPRVCGGSSQVNYDPQRNDESSPRMRGLFEHPRLAGALRCVVPASAGVVLPSRF
jgi:hypothetical protein